MSEIKVTNCKAQRAFGVVRPLTMGKNKAAILNVHGAVESAKATSHQPKTVPFVYIYICIYV